MEATPEDQHSHHGQGQSQCIQINEGPHASTSYECTIMHSASYRAASNQTTYCATSTYFPWDGKYMEAINACPHHGFDTWLLVSYFYDGMSSSMKQLLETMCGGDFMRRSGKMKSQPNALNAKAGMYTLNEDIDMKAKVAAMTRRLEELELKKIPLGGGVSYNSSVREMFGDQANVIGQFKPNNNASYGNTYNSNWRNHPNFSWKPRALQYTQPGQASQQASNLEQAIVNLSKKIDNLQYSISRLTNLNTVQEKGRFPSQPHQNPKGIHEVEAHEGESSQVKGRQSHDHSRSGKEVELPTPKPHDETESEKETEKREEIKGKKKAVEGKRTMIQQ
ncbi:hypothetical protein CK203_082670 [Vitis vinifera]|uniref:Retrotransposon gag domain-containing protein n=1 Tax=Vitis vinifera TaxID=29760 RepID=A0A438BWV9_VITVI|nr:hypothetical protein CK203_082670 [Vitis vinifera]